MRLELTLAGLLVKLANHCTTRGALKQLIVKFLCAILSSKLVGSFVFFFNGILNILGYLMPKPYLLNSDGPILPTTVGIREIIPPPRVFVRKRTK